MPRRRKPKAPASRKPIVEPQVGREIGPKEIFNPEIHIERRKAQEPPQTVWRGTKYYARRPPNGGWHTVEDTRRKAPKKKNLSEPKKSR